MSKATEWWKQMKVAKDAAPRFVCAPYLKAAVADGAESIMIERETSGKVVLTTSEALCLARWILDTVGEGTS